MQRHVITTADGSTTIHLEEWNEQYHSIHGAIQEANHVYIKEGLLFCLDENIALEKSISFQTHTKSKIPKISVLEIGFGTGLNAFLTLLNAQEHHIKVSYIGVEAYPITSEEIATMNYADQVGHPQLGSIYKNLHTIPWEETIPLTPYFSLQKQQKCFEDITNKDQFDLIYFDAFGARVQPELWTETIFKIMYEALKDQGILVTYSAKGSVRRNMQKVGFKIEKLGGPPGKREMLRAVKR